jgi:tetraacyldisaccharide 4'-kinase
VVSRGYGRKNGTDVALVAAASSAAEVGDEPLLIHRRTGVPVCVGRDRVSALHTLCTQHPRVDLVISDDGLQHAALRRVAELWVFDDRGIGNGRLLPAGPLRAPLPRQVPASARVLYTGALASTPLPGAMAQRGLSRALPLAAWWAGDTRTAVALDSLRRDGLRALAGIAAPEKFFTMLEAHGLRFVRIEMPDHATYASLPWPAGAADVLVTEKDAVKLDPQRVATTTRVWVVPLDFVLPRGLVDDLAALLPERPRSEPTP